MGLLDFFIEMFQRPEAAFRKLTPELIGEKKRKLFLRDYLRWLKRTITYYEAMVMEIREKGGSVPQDWVEKIEMLKKELSDIQR